MNQSVSHFDPSIACRKEGNFAPNRNSYNLSVFNSLQRVFAATGVAACAPASPTTSRQG
jgi:hypothetical protein